MAMINHLDRFQHVLANGGKIEHAYVICNYNVRFWLFLQHPPDELASSPTLDLLHCLFEAHPLWLGHLLTILGLHCAVFH